MNEFSDTDSLDIAVFNSSGYVNILGWFNLGLILFLFSILTGVFCYQLIKKKIGNNYAVFYSMFGFFTLMLTLFIFFKSMTNYWSYQSCCGLFSPEEFSRLQFEIFFLAMNFSLLPLLSFFLALLSFLLSKINLCKSV